MEGRLQERKGKDRGLETEGRKEWIREDERREEGRTGGVERPSGAF